MEVRDSVQVERKLSVFAYSQMGAGKTELGASFPNPVWVDFDRSDMTLDARGLSVPVLSPENEDEIRALIDHPEEALTALLKETKFEGYKAETFVWDTVSSMQNVIFGDGPRKAVDVFGGAIQLEKETPWGIMKEPNSRDHPSIPAPKDYRLFEVRFRGIIAKIRQMPYHSVVTSHSGLDLTPDSPRGLTAPDSQKTYMGYPNIIGKMKYDLGKDYDFYLYLFARGGSHFMAAQDYGKFNARTRIKGSMPAQVDWTNKSAFKILTDYYNKSKEKNK